jgi:hypothetical protein
VHVLHDDEHLILLGGEFLGESDSRMPPFIPPSVNLNIGIDDFAGEGDKSLDVRISLVSDVFL